MTDLSRMLDRRFNNQAERTVVEDCGIAYAVTDGNDILFCGAEFIGTQTSNYAELYAIMRCLEEVSKRLRER